MGPNLKRLFAEATQKQLCRVPDTANVYALNENGYNRIAFQIQADSRDVSISECRSTAKKLVLLWNHGEALIAALERLLEENEDYIRINNLSAMGNVNLVEARQLLAQIESEAQP